MTPREHFDADSKYKEWGLFLRQFLFYIQKPLSWMFSSPEEHSKLTMGTFCTAEPMRMISIEWTLMERHHFRFRINVHVHMNHLQCWMRTLSNLCGDKIVRWAAWPQITWEGPTCSRWIWLNTDAEYAVPLWNQRSAKHLYIKVYIDLPPQLNEYSTYEFLASSGCSWAAK